MRQFMEIVDGDATGLIVDAGGLYDGLRYGVNSADSVYIEVGLYPYSIGSKPSFDRQTQKLEFSYSVTDFAVVKEYVAVLLTQEELDANDNTTLNSMLEEGNVLSIKDEQRVKVGAAGIISDQIAFEAWMKKNYDEMDGNGIVLFKPPAAERQIMAIELESRDTYTFTRFNDQWGYRWRMELIREDITNLAVAIYDQSGNYLYTTGKLLPNAEGGWYTECPAGQADAAPEDVYYKWLLGAGDISGLQVYKGVDETIEGVVRSDERYD